MATAIKSREYQVETMESYFFEVYTNQPNQDGTKARGAGVPDSQRGWDIKVGFVMATSPESGRAKVKARIDRKYGFDTFIQFYRMDLCPLGCDIEFVR